MPIMSQTIPMSATKKIISSTKGTGSKSSIYIHDKKTKTNDNVILSNFIILLRINFHKIIAVEHAKAVNCPASG